MSNIITNEQVKQYLNISLKDPALNDFLDVCIAWAEDKINGFCNHNILSASITDYFNGINSCYLTLPHTNVTAVSNLYTRETPLDTWEAVATADFALINESSVFRIYYSGGFIEGNNNIKVVYTAGYTAGNIPQTIQNVCVEMVAMMYKESKQGIDTLGYSSISRNLSGVSENTGFKDMWKVWTEQLTGWRVPN